MASVNGRRVVWYDVTGGKEDVEVLKYAEMEWN